MIWVRRLLPLVLALAVSVGLLAVFTHSPDHVKAIKPAAAALVVDGHHRCVGGAANLSVHSGSDAQSVGTSSDEATDHSNVASCLAALLVVIGGLMAGVRLLVLSASWWTLPRSGLVRIRLGAISAMLCAPSPVRLSRLLI
ncbi:MAG: hypothetical protein HOV67_00540 [Kribbellaceae bacterium]|nr:hypothetical protein [Catenulispora sp.]NUR93722.1 hypothetical protein [Kribbellaceae bacterium]